MAETLTVDLYADPDSLPIATGVPLDEAFRDVGMRRAAVNALRSQGQFWCDPEYMKATSSHPEAVFASVSPIKTSGDLGNYCRAHDTASHLDAFHKGLSPIVKRLEAAKTELEACGASADTQYEFELAVAALTDALEAVATEAEPTA